MKRVLLTFVAVATLLAGASQYANASYRATINPTANDTASVLLKKPGSTMTLRINWLKVFYDGGAGTNIWAGLVMADAARFVLTPLRGNSVTANTNGAISLEGPIWLTNAGADSLNAVRTDTLGVATPYGGAFPVLFISGASTDSLAAQIDYDIVHDTR